MPVCAGIFVRKRREPPESVDVCDTVPAIGFIGRYWKFAWNKLECYHIFAIM